MRLKHELAMKFVEKPVNGAAAINICHQDLQAFAKEPWIVCSN